MIQRHDLKVVEATNDSDRGQQVRAFDVGVNLTRTVKISENEMGSSGKPKPYSRAVDTENAKDEIMNDLYGGLLDQIQQRGQHYLVQARMEMDKFSGQPFPGINALHNLVYELRATLFRVMKHYPGPDDSGDLSKSLPYDPLWDFCRRNEIDCTPAVEKAFYAGMREGMFQKKACLVNE